MLTVLLLSMLSPFGPALTSLAQDKQDSQKLDVENTKLLVFDSAKGITLKIQNDGKVELTVREEDRETGKKTSRTYAAAGGAEFRQKYPDLVKKYDLGRTLGGEGKAVSPEDFDQWWKALKKGIPDPGPIPGFEQPFDEDFQKLLEEQLGRLRRPFRQAPPVPEAPPRQAPIPGGRELGVKVQDVGETLRDQLGLKENEGVLVTEVKPESIAGKAGFKEHDILLKLEGKAVTDRWQFRADVLTALGKPEFEVEMLRGGKRTTVKVKTSAKKDE
jgi:PDZ domain-containing protein